MSDELDAALYTKDDLFAAIRNATATGSYTDVDDIYSELVADSDASNPEKSIRDNVATEFKPVYVGYVDDGDTYNAEGLARVLTDR